MPDVLSLLFSPPVLVERCVTATPYRVSLLRRLSEARDKRTLPPAGLVTLDFRFMFSRVEIGCIKVRIWYFSLKMRPEGVCV